MYTALILDDEELARKNLSGLLRRNCPDVSIVFEAENIAEAQLVLSTHDIHLLFMDVDLGGVTGFDLIETTGDIQPAIIFVTAHEEYAIKAVKARALDYLLKPVDIDELIAAVAKLKKIPAPHIAEAQHARNSNRLLVPNGDGFEVLNAAQIIFAEAHGNYTRFCLEGNRKVISSRQLGSYEDELPAESFFRSHKSYIINMDHLVGYSSRDGYTALLSGNCQVPVSRRRLSAFLGIVKNLDV